MTDKDPLNPPPQDENPNSIVRNVGELKGRKYPPQQQQGDGDGNSGQQQQAEISDDSPEAHKKEDAGWGGNDSEPKRPRTPSEEFTLL